MVKSKRSKLIAGALATLMFAACAFMLVLNNGNTKADAAATTYTVNFNRNLFSSDSALDLKQYVKEVEVTFYNSSDQFEALPVYTVSKTQLDYNNWTNNSAVTVTGEFTYYKVKFTLYSGTYDGVYWYIPSGGHELHGGISAQTPAIFMTGTINPCAEITLKKYEFIKIECTQRTGFLFYTFKLKLTQNNSNAVVVDYNKNLCFGWNAEKWSGLNDLATHERALIGLNMGSETITINPGGTATYAAVSFFYHRITDSNQYKYKTQRLVTRMTNIKVGSGDLYYSIVDGPEEEPKDNWF